MQEINLYPHNQDTYNKIQEMWKTTNRVAAVQATGTGKSFLILKCLFGIPDENKAILAPSEYIFEQLQENVGIEIPNTQYITYAKIALMTDDEIKHINPSLIILDEFHRCGAEQWGKGVQTLLNIFPNAKVLGTSATPIRYLDNERDMSDELFDGNVAVNLSLAEAIVKGILPMPKYISALYTFEDEVENLKHKVITSHNSEEEKEELLNQIDLMRNKLDRSKGIPKILQKHLTEPNDKFIVFCKNKEHLYEIKPIVINWFKKTKLNDNIETYIVYTGYKNSNQEFEEFKNNNNPNSLKLLFSIDMLNEGLHIDDITGVILLRPTVSPIIYYQQIGRAIDAGNSKQPIIFDFVNNFDNLGATQFVDDLEKYRKKEIRNKRKNYLEKDIDIPEFIIWDEIKEVKELFNRLESNLIDNWEFMYEQLRQYSLENNDYTRNIYRNIKDEKLVNWITFQRKMYKKKLMSENRINLLNQINFIWDNEHEIYWHDMYEKLKFFKETYGHTNVSNEYNINLHQWVYYQKELYKLNKLSKNKIEKLNILGFIWEYETDLKWENMFNELKNSDNYLNNKQLARWVNAQRALYKKNKLSKMRIDKLNSINFKWDGQERIVDQSNEMHINNILIVNNLSSSEFAKTLNITKSTINNWRSNKSNISKKYIIIIADIFKIDPNLIEPQKRD